MVSRKQFHRNSLDVRRPHSSLQAGSSVKAAHGGIENYGRVGVALCKKKVALNRLLMFLHQGLHSFLKNRAVNFSTGNFPEFLHCGYPQLPGAAGIADEENAP